MGKIKAMKKILFAILFGLCLNIYGQDPVVRSVRFEAQSEAQMNAIPENKLQQGSVCYRSDTNSIWRYNGTTWAELSGGSLTDGNKGDITVTGGVWDIDAGVVGSTEIANGSIDELDLDVSVNASLDLADSSTQPGDNVSTLTNDAGYITSQTDDQTASEVPITDTGNNYTGTNAELAFAEVADSLAVKVNINPNSAPVEVFRGTYAEAQAEYGVDPNTWPAKLFGIIPDYPTTQSSLDDLSDVTKGSPAANSSPTLRVLADPNTDGNYNEIDWTPPIPDNTDFVDLTSNQTIAGIKNFSGTIQSTGTFIGDNGATSVGGASLATGDNYFRVNGYSFSPSTDAYISFLIDDAAPANNPIEKYLVASENDITYDGISLLGGGGLASTDIDTYTELNSIVADVTLTHNGLIDTFAELNTIVADKTLVNLEDAQTFTGLKTFSGTAAARMNGYLALQEGAATGSTAGYGSLTAQSGGQLRFLGAGETNGGRLAFTGLSADRTYTFQDASGTVALTSDLTKEIQIACSDLTTDITTGTTKAYFRMPYAMTVTEVRVSLLTAGTTTGITVDINEGGVSILSTLLTTDATEKTSTTATTAAVISDSALADDAEITIDFDAVPTGGQGVIVTLIGTKA